MNMSLRNTKRERLKEIHQNFGWGNLDLGTSDGAAGWETAIKVAGSIPDGVILTFYWFSPPGRTTSLGSNQPLTEMSTRNISWGWRWPVRGAEKPYHVHLRIVFKCGNLNLLEPTLTVQSCTGITKKSISGYKETLGSCENGNKNVGFIYIKYSKTCLKRTPYIPETWKKGK